MPKPIPSAICLLASATVAFAWRVEQPAEKPAASQPATAAKVEKLDWLAGDWRSVEPGSDTGEFWLPPKGGSMFDVSRTYRGDKLTDFEFLRISENQESGLVYYAQPRGRAPTPFKLKDVGDRKVVFVNAENDFPNTITYWIDADSLLHGRIDGKMDGQDRSMEWVWKRAAK
ncbi:MAG: DUF6265 family protein [Phycisphaerae bacterium]|nr:DUF6265 family protein [Phycisphaerae bacterium]